MNGLRLLAALAPLVLAACAGATPRDCTPIYALGDSGVSAAIAGGRTVMKPGPMPAMAVPPGAPRAALEPDGSYAGGRVFCSVPEARAALTELRARGAIPAGRPWRVYEVAASWREDVYQSRPGEYRLKRSARMVREAHE
ncbi:MAG: DVU_2496 family lipoprotein [Burkholderiales bacterium]